MSEGRLEMTIPLPATPAEVWRMLSTRQGLTSWFAAMDMEPRVGFASALGTVTAWEEGSRLATETLDFTVDEGANDTAVLRFVQTGIQGGQEECDAFERGWNMYFGTLEQYFVHFRGRDASYIEAGGPPASGADGSWEALLTGLGAGDEAGAGDAVRLPAHGGAATDGVIDYVDRTYFLGLRTADGLYRFHCGGARSDAPLAAGHYIYTPAVDAGEAQKGWQSWLDQTFTDEA
jgi:hypothetical protein